MKKLLLAAALAVFSFPVLAADITAKNKGYDSVVSQSDPWLWEQVNNDDTTKEQPIAAGEYLFFIDGTPDDVDLQLQWGKTSGSLKDLDTDTMPDGVKFDSASTGYAVKVCLGTGYADIKFNSVGSTQDIDIWMERLGDC